MPSFGHRSNTNLGGVHPDLADVCRSAIRFYDFSVIWGFRGEADQNDCYDRGTSNARWPDSAHNRRIIRVNEPDTEVPDSHAVDIVPYYATRPHIRWDQHEEFIHLAGYMLMAAAILETKIIWGGDWDDDQDLHDFNKPFDLAHFELV